MVTVGMTLAYLRSFQEKELAMGLVAAGIGLVVGLIAGFLGKRTADTIYWSILGGLFAFLCSVGYDLFHPSYQVGWMLVGAASGAAASLSAPGHPLRSMFVSSIVGGAVLGSFAFYTPGFPGEAMLEVVCALIAGGLLGAAIEAVFWAERRNRISRHAIATGLILSVICGNIIAKTWIPWWKLLSD
jgi:hypothetical protein